jgi:hypothetical protein
MTFVVPYKPSVDHTQKTPSITVDMFTVLLPSTGHGANHIENTSQVIAISPVHWRPEFFLARSYIIRPIVACDPVPGGYKYGDLVLQVGGSLESERVKYGHESRRTLTQ